jgi:AraC family transcriptional regulator of adaptative response / DNA-3-methyladenine glycosylase II
MTDAQMYSRLLASDASFNGRFFVGVTSTGIYCLPSCRARKPKVENVKFFPTAEAARATGLRACKKCHPDDFARGADPVLETIETVVAEIRANPAAFPDVRAVVLRSGFGATRVFELFRLHYHTTPADLLLRARLDSAKKILIGTRRGLAAIAGEVGFESLSVFHEHVRKFNGLPPVAYRELSAEKTFELALPAGYSLGYLRRAFSRDVHSLTERLEGDLYTSAVLLGGGPAILVMKLETKSVRVEVSAPPASSTIKENKRTTLPSLVEAHAIAVGLLGLDQDAAAFVRLAKRLGLTRLTAERNELRISQTHSVYEGMLWSIIGQQINFAFACLLRRRLVERAGVALGNGLYAPPTPQAVAALTIDDLLPLQFSRSKADYVIATSRLVVDGKLDLDSLRHMSATRAERTLLAIRGLGPWSVNYIMMRALGFPDCVPLGDTGVTSGLLALLKLDERPDIDATKRLMTVFSPYRSLATTHLWQFNHPIP